MKRSRYRFVGRNGTAYVWESVLPIGPNESRHDQIRADIGWFWNNSRRRRGLPPIEVKR